MPLLVDMIWVGETEFIITESGNFIVPRTGRYMLELYGGGGGVSNTDDLMEGRAVQGGSSCSFLSTMKGETHDYPETD